MKLTVLILAKNEEKYIGDCLKSVAFADEIIVIDDFSTDATKEISLAHGAKVVRHALNGDWGAQQTFAIGQASSPWVFFIDADERVSRKLRSRIQNILAQDDRRFAYKVARLNYFWEQPLLHGGWFPDYVVRLFPADGSSVTGKVHPAIVHPYEEKFLTKDEHMIHYPYRDWEHYFGKLNLYTTLAAKKMQEKGKRARLLDFVSHPFWAAFRMYVLQGGWRDGRIGFVLACFHYFYTMAKYVKLYYLEKTNGHTGDEK